MANKIIDTIREWQEFESINPQMTVREVIDIINKDKTQAFAGDDTMLVIRENSIGGIIKLK